MASSVGADDPDPKRTYSVEKTLSLFPRLGRLPEVEQRRRPPRGQGLYDTIRAIAGSRAPA